MPDIDSKTGQAEAAGCPFSIVRGEDRDPFSIYEEMRPQGPLVWDEIMNGWAVFDYATCVHVETREDLFRNVYVDAPSEVIDVKGGPGNLTVVSGEAHKRLRNFQLKLLSSQAVAAIREANVRPVIDMLVDRIAGDGRADLATALSDQVPVRVIMSLFGLPWQDDALAFDIAHYHEDIATYLGRKFEGGDYYRRADAASKALNAILLPHIRARRDRPADDFISRVWLGAPDFYGDITEETVLSICRELFFGGGDTTTHAISNALWLMLTRADLRAVIATDRGQSLTRFIEEMLRLYGSVQYRFRIAYQACELGGRAVQKDQLLILLHAAANRDPARYDDPASVSLERRPASDHLTFNKGPRGCIGAALARTEINLTLQATLDRLPNVRLDPDAEPPAFRSLFFRSFRPLHVLFD
jgi:cytochrome P450